MILPILLGRLFAGQDGQIAVEKVAEAVAGRIDISAVAIDEIHRHIERIVGIAFIAEAVLEHEGQHARARGVGIRPDMAAIGQEAIGLAIGEGRIGEERSGERLKRQRDSEFLRHVGFAAIIEIGLDRAGAQHHVEAERAHARHVAQHDLVAPLGHDRQVGAALVRPHAKAKEAEAELVADMLDLFQMPAGLRAGLMQIFERRARQFQLARRLQADGPIAARQGDDVAAFIDRGPAIAGQADQQRVDAALFLIGRSVMIAAIIDELFMLGADAPAVLGLFALGKGRDQLLAAFDDGIMTR